MPASRHAHPRVWNREEQIDWALTRKALDKIDIALLSFEDLESASRALQSGAWQSRSRAEARLWAAADTFLLSSAMISDLFRIPGKWTPPPVDIPRRVETAVRARRARRFSQAFGIDSRNPFHVTDVRNSFVHFFERYEALVRDERTRLGSDRGHVPLRDDWWERGRLRLRNIEPESLRISFLGQVVDARSVASELRRLRAKFIDRVPTRKQEERLNRRLRARDHASLLEMGDSPPTPLPADWDAAFSVAQHGSPGARLLEAFTTEFNNIVSTGRSEDFAMLFDRLGSLDIQRSRLQQYNGRTEILRRFSHHRPRSHLWVTPPLVDTPGLVLSTYGWSQLPEGEEGILRLRFTDGKICHALLRAIPGRVGVVTTGKAHRYRHLVYYTFRV